MTRLVLKAFGARVYSVDEEGEVSLFCYSLNRNFDLHVSGSEEQKRWGARIGDKVTIQILAEPYQPPPPKPADCNCDQFWMQPGTGHHATCASLLEATDSPTND